MPRLSSDYQAARAWLYGTQLFGIKLGLENIQRLLAELQVPKGPQRIVHVAGTNGKGSVCAMAAAICRAAGLRTGLFTSPHLVTFRERIQVNGEMITEAEVAAGLSVIRKHIADWSPHPTFFEIATALALRYFDQRGCEIAILETGLGGRLDATNAVRSSVSVITPIDFDHQQWLGNTIEEIAGEKAGIIKPNTPVVSGPQLPEAKRVIRAKAAACGAPLRFVEERYEASLVALPGNHQCENAALAIAALDDAQISADAAAISAGLAQVDWPARFQRWDERTIIDGAHNPAGARVLADTWRASFGLERAVLVLGLLREKDASGIWDALAPVADSVVLPPFRSQRALAPEELADVIHKTSPKLEVGIAPSLGEGLKHARKKGAHVLITGSLHFAGEVLAYLRGKPTAFEECAQ